MGLNAVIILVPTLTFALILDWLYKRIIRNQTAGRVWWKDR